MSRSMSPQVCVMSSSALATKPLANQAYSCGGVVRDHAQGESLNSPIRTHVRGRVTDSRLLATKGQAWRSVYDNSTMAEMPDCPQPLGPSRRI